MVASIFTLLLISFFTPVYSQISSLTTTFFVSSAFPTPTFADATTTSLDAPAVTTSIVAFPSPTILDPQRIEYCSDNLIAWTDGLGPYHFIVYPEDLSITVPREWNRTISNLETTWFNDRILPGDSLTISIIDSNNFIDTKTYVVVPSSIIRCDKGSEGPVFSSSHIPRISPGAIMGIVLAVLFLIIGAVVWFCRRKSARESRTKVIPYAFERRKSAADNQSIRSGRSFKSVRSGTSMWSGFTRSDKPFTEEGVRVQVDTVQVTESHSAPVSDNHTAIPLFNVRRTTREWSGYAPPTKYNRLRADQTTTRYNSSQPRSNPAGGPISLQSAISTELTQLGVASPDPSPNGIPNPSQSDSRYSETDPFETESVPPVAGTLSQSEMEKLADLVAYRLRHAQKLEGGVGPERNSDAPPDYE